MAAKGQGLSQLRESRTIFENKYAQRSKERWGFKWVWETDSTRQTRSFVQRISQKCHQVGKRSMIIIRTNQNSIHRQSLQKLSETNTTFMETSWSRVEKGAVTVIRPPPHPPQKIWPPQERNVGSAWNWNKAIKTLTLVFCFVSLKVRLAMDFCKFWM